MHMLFSTMQHITFRLKACEATIALSGTRLVLVKVKGLVPLMSI